MPMLPLPTMPSGPIPIVVVASWYPSVSDPVAGRFVADQMAALSRRGTVAPSVVSFDPAGLTGAERVRIRTASSIDAHVGAAVRSRKHLFTAPPLLDTAGSGFVPVARLGIPVGQYRRAGVSHALAARIPALDALAHRWASGLEVDVPLPALVHAHTVYPDGAAAARLAARLGCPLVLTEHASTVGRLIESAEIRRIYVATVKSAYRLVAVSRSLAEELSRLMPELEPLSTVIPNGIEMAEFRAPAPGVRRPSELLFVGHRKPSKGISTLLLATRLARVEVPGLTLRLIGGSPTEAIEAGWRSEAERLGIADIVSFDGPTDRNGVADAMARASVFVHPSPRETFGVVAVEALASGLPVVASDSGGVSEILGTGVDDLGALVPRNRPDALAAAIVATLNRRAAFDPTRLRSYVAERYGADVVAGWLEELYREAIGAERSTKDPTPRVRVPGKLDAVTEPSAPRPVGLLDSRIVMALDPDRASVIAAVVGQGNRRGTAAAPVLVTTAAWPGPDNVFRRVIRLPARVRVSGLADAAALRSGRTGARQWLQLMRHPMALARRRGWLPGFATSIAAMGTSAIQSVIDASSEGGAGSRFQGPIEIVCCDGVDHLAAEEMIHARLVVPAPGGVRWFGDVMGSVSADEREQESRTGLVR